MNPTDIPPLIRQKRPAPVGPFLIGAAIGILAMLPFVAWGPSKRPTVSPEPLAASAPLARPISEDINAMAALVRSKAFLERMMGGMGYLIVRDDVWQTRMGGEVYPYTVKIRVRYTSLNGVIEDDALFACASDGTVLQLLGFAPIFRTRVERI